MNLGLINTSRLLVFAGMTTALVGSAVLFPQSVCAQQVSINEAKSTLLLQLPPAREKIKAAVHKFRYVTDQQKQGQTERTKRETPTAVTQDYTAILLRTLEESGWFAPIEYDNVVSLLTPPQNTSLNGAPPVADGKSTSVPSVAVFLEGGILAYETNSLSDEHRVEFFGPGSPKQYQQDRVTLYLRAISTQSGRILKTIYTSKTLYSQAVSANLFRFVSFKRPYEAETGLTPVMPGQLTMTEAIKQAVQGLIIEGARDGLWLPIEKSELAMTTAISTYEQGKADASEPDAVERLPVRGPLGITPRMDAPFISLHPYVGILRYNGDYTIRDSKNAYGVSAEMYIVPIVGIQINAATGTMASQDAFSVNLTSLEANIIFRPLPFQQLTPIVYAGAGVVSRSRSTPFQLYGDKYGQAQFGVGLQFSPNRVFGFRSSLSYNLPFTDALDGRVMGNRNDFYSRVTLGLVIHIGRFLRNTTPITFTQVAQPKN